MPQASSTLPENISKSLVFPNFSGGIERDYRYGMG